MTDKVRILIVEDDPVTASETSAMLRSAGWEVDVDSTLSDGIASATSQKYKVIILDRMLPDGDGIDAIARFRAGGSDAMVLVVSALGLAANRIEGLDRGADDYISKPFEAGELVARVRAMLRRRLDVTADNDLIVFGALEIRLKARTVHVGQAHVTLSPREFDLLVFFARNHGDVLTRMQLLEHVWNLHFDPQTNVVDVHVSRLRRKLDAALPAPVLHTKRGEGYIFDPDRLTLPVSDMGG